MDGHKTESQVTESTGEVGSPQCAQKESGSRVSRPQCPVCVSPVYNFHIRHMWNDHLNNSVVYKLASTHLAKFPPSLDVNPSRRHLPRIRLPVRAFPARHCQKSPISPRHLGRRSTLVNIRLVANVPLTLHTDAQLPWYGNSLQTSVPLCHCRLAFRRACHGAHELVSHEAHELFNSCFRNRLRHQVCRVHTRVNLLRGEPA